jgi:hypothetical protein
MITWPKACSALSKYWPMIVWLAGLALVIYAMVHTSLV